ncbi:hypothetical protein FPQ18DRAFT_303561 [Pyronema domesticum]|uniref:Uncharacterized protein n=1 Tax=Pyronema omphalodes (strain CBS 100304) TaxID=1076935 RepID=U4LV91_PYROM|nr:hypothetical protein FPQ18DRAFT_303561 [Pyronema domesticum]CCX32326.1 Protein of unknown function [Pyronema omphalodes CBS 100304]
MQFSLLILLTVTALSSTASARSHSAYIHNPKCLWRNDKNGLEKGNVGCCEDKTKKDKCTPWTKDKCQEPAMAICCPENVPIPFNGKAKGCRTQFGTLFDANSFVMARRPGDV